MGVKYLLAQAQNPDFWRRLNPELTLSENLPDKSLPPLTVELEHLKKLLLTLKKEGYFQIDSLLPESEFLPMAATVKKLLQSGWPPPFAFVYDEFWQIFCRLSQILSAVLGENYKQLPDFWAWYIEANNTNTGWAPHRDKGFNTLLADGMPKSVTIWIPLSDAIPLNGCMYILPAPFDPYYGSDSPKNEIANFQDIRALPAVAGSVLCWNQAVLHWGGRSSERAPHPRISFAFEFQRGDVAPYNTPLLDSSVVPNFNQRLGLIGKQILQYKHMYPLSEQLAELAVELKKNTFTSKSQKPQEIIRMDAQESGDLVDKIRQQFETGPYPRIPLEESPKDGNNFIFYHNYVTPFYLRNQKVIESEGKVILDAGCGTGYKALALAIANPAAKIVGLDISEESVHLARKRLQYHGVEDAEFYVLSIEDLPSLGMEFDYINNDEVLYLLRDPVKGLQAMKSVLKPDGIIRSNLHSSLQRVFFFRAQEVFRMMGLMDENPRELEISIVRETMKALKDETLLKAKTWNSKNEEDEQWFLMNYLLQGDKGYTIPEMFAALRAADLEFISMVNWRQWEVLNLFKDPDDLPAYLGLALPEISLEDRLHLFELLNPCHRLLDFWCGHPNRAQPFVPVAEWTDSDWEGAKVHLHPNLRTPQVREDLLNSIANHRPWEISKYITVPTTQPIVLESSTAACLLPLWEGAQPVKSLVERQVQIRPLDPATLQQVSEKTALKDVKRLLSSVEVFLYVLLEQSA